MDDIIPIAGILMSTILGSIPLIGLTIRFAIRPAVESFVQATGEAQGRRMAPEAEARLDHMEAEMAQIRARLEYMADTQAFDRHLSDTTAVTLPPPSR